MVIVVCRTGQTKKNVNDTFRRFKNYRKDTTRPTKFDKNSFSNYIEGFGVDDPCEVRGTDKEETLCGKSPLIRRRLHNLVRILYYISVGKQNYMHVYCGYRFMYSWEEQ